MGAGKVLLITTGSIVAAGLIFGLGIATGRNEYFNMGVYNTPASASVASSVDGQSIRSLPQVVQSVLAFTPKSADGMTILDMSEKDYGYSSWEGSDSVPGTFATYPAKHGASFVVWTLTTKPGGLLSGNPATADLVAMGAAEYFGSSMTSAQIKKDTKRMAPGHTIHLDFHLSQNGQVLTGINYFSIALTSFNQDTLNASS
ncbi:MAG: hypothetical protein OWR62_16245 [Sulfobacillus thermotolerans]|nr:hypothetical protein [Sulfobacillus thermotolerans]